MSQPIRGFVCIIATTNVYLVYRVPRQVQGSASSPGYHGPASSPVGWPSEKRPHRRTRRGGPIACQRVHDCQLNRSLPEGGPDHGTRRRCPSYTDVCGHHWT